MNSPQRERVCECVYHHSPSLSCTPRVISRAAIVVLYNIPPHPNGKLARESWMGRKVAKKSPWSKGISHRRSRCLRPLSWLMGHKTCSVLYTRPLQRTESACFFLLFCGQTDCPCQLFRTLREIQCMRATWKWLHFLRWPSKQKRKAFFHQSFWNRLFTTSFRRTCRSF